MRIKTCESFAEDKFEHLRSETRGIEGRLSSLASKESIASLVDENSKMKVKFDMEFD